jgi:hypothetical protein
MSTIAKRPNSERQDPLNNFGPGGSAQIIFSSDPNLIPEPGTFTLIGTGLAFAAARLRRKSA